ncbi:hypothetical protein D3C81_2168840 [compost metagenome]
MNAANEKLRAVGCYDKGCVAFAGGLGEGAAHTSRQGRVKKRFGLINEKDTVWQAVDGGY